MRTHDEENEADGNDQANGGQHKPPTIAMLQVSHKADPRHGVSINLKPNTCTKTFYTIGLSTLVYLMLNRERTSLKTVRFGSNKDQHVWSMLRSSWWNTFSDLHCNQKQNTKQHNTKMEQKADRPLCFAVKMVCHKRSSYHGSLVQTENSYL